MFGWLLSLFGCGNNQTKNVINEPITQEMIDTLSGGDLNFKVLYALSDSDNNASREVVSLIYELDGEVNNGGFNQYYFNPFAENRYKVEEALRKIGALDFAELVNRANNCYEKICPELEKYDDGTAESFLNSYENNPLTVFDAEYYQLNEDGKLYTLVAQFIKKNAADFITIK